MPLGTFEKSAGGMEVKKVFYLVGAEKERKELEKLLRRRAEFTGSTVAVEEVWQQSTTLHESNTGLVQNINNKRRNKVVGFGKEYAEVYGIGERFNEYEEMITENTRFALKTDVEDVPNVVKSRKGGKNWATGETLEVDEKVLEKKAINIKRNKLVYSGLSL